MSIGQQGPQKNTESNGASSAQRANGTEGGDSFSASMDKAEGGKCPMSCSDPNAKAPEDSQAPEDMGLGQARNVLAALMNALSSSVGR